MNNALAKHQLSKIQACTKATETPTNTDTHADTQFPYNKLISTDS